MRTALTTLLLCLTCATGSAQDYKITQLEQELRDLKRQVQEQQRQLEALKTQRMQPAPLPPLASATAPAQPVAWLDAARWNRIQVGMNELEVVSLLGPPTTTRVSGTDRVLLYAMEIGSAAFLSGSVTCRDRVVIAVEKPALR
jgi:hypothetical protein